MVAGSLSEILSGQVAGSAGVERSAVAPSFGAVDEDTTAPGADGLAGCAAEPQLAIAIDTTSAPATRYATATRPRLRPFDNELSSSLRPRPRSLEY
jgi:hypothetical protein